MQPSIFELRIAEINEQPNFNAGGFQVIDNLGFVFRGQRADSFQLNNNHIFYQQIGIK